MSLSHVPVVWLILIERKVESSVGHAHKTPLKGLRFERLEEARAYLDHQEARWADTRIHAPPSVYYQCTESAQCIWMIVRRSRGCQLIARTESSITAELAPEGDRRARKSIVFQKWSAKQPARYYISFKRGVRDRSPGSRRKGTLTEGRRS